MIGLHQASDKALVGNKAHALHALLKIGMPVPPGFVIPHNAEEKQIVDYVKSKARDRLYAVRSSSNMEDSDKHSFAGMFKTKLCVPRHELVKAIIEVRDITDLDRLKEICEQTNTPTSSVKVSVLVQEMVASDVSGICFTRNPVTGNRNEIIIEAALGLGEFVVGGDVTPDYYRYGKDGQLRKKEVSAQHKRLVLDIPPRTEHVFAYKEKLKDRHAQELIRLAKVIEMHMDYRADIEWAIERDRLFILQSRPITKG